MFYSVDDFLFGFVLVQGEVTFLLSEAAVRSVHAVLLEQGFSDISPVSDTFGNAGGRKDDAVWLWIARNKRENKLSSREKIRWVGGC